MSDSEWFTVLVAGGGVVVSVLFSWIVARRVGRKAARSVFAAGEYDARRAGRFALAEVLVDLISASQDVEPSASLGTARPEGGEAREIHGYGPDDRVRALVDLAVNRARDNELADVGASLEAELAKWDGGLQRWNLDESESGAGEQDAREALSKTIKARDAFASAVNDAVTSTRAAIQAGGGS